MFTFSRLSTEDGVPVISRVIINNVSEGLNGVEIQFIEAGMINSATSTIHIIGGRLLIISGSNFYVHSRISSCSLWEGLYIIDYKCDSFTQCLLAFN